LGFDGCLVVGKVDLLKNFHLAVGHNHKRGFDGTSDGVLFRLSWGIGTLVK
jgi:hypothetical protein